MKEINLIKMIKILYIKFKYKFQCKVFNKNKKLKLK